MSFRTTLKDIVETTEGGLAAVLMGFDGIAIEEYLKEDPGYDLQLLAVEYATLLKEIRRTVELLRTGSLEEVSITTELARTIVRPVGQDFFLALVLRCDGNFGKGRYLLRVAAPRLGDML